MKRLRYFIFLMIPFFVAIQSFGEKLPEFYGCYLKKQDNSILELTKNKNVYSTGWFVKKPKKSFQEQLSSGGGDLGAALRAAGNTKTFIVESSGISIPSEELSGLIFYGEFNVDDIKIYKLSNRVVPSNATFANYHGPKPIDRSNMWFAYKPYDFRSKPIQDKMYFIKTREPLRCGCYAVKIERNMYDFEISSQTGGHPLVGKWVGKRYYKERKVFGKTKSQIIEWDIKEVDHSGTIEGTYKMFANNKVIREDSWPKDQIVKINKTTNTIKFITPDGPQQEAKKGAINGDWEGTINLSDGRCNCGDSAIKISFKPYEKFKNHDFVKKYKLSQKMEKQ